VNSRLEKEQLTPYILSIAHPNSTHTAKIVQALCLFRAQPSTDYLDAFIGHDLDAAHNHGCPSFPQLNHKDRIQKRRQMVILFVSPLTKAGDPWAP
jgi:hypothetical protein